MSKMFGEEKRLQKSGYTFLRTFMFLTFMDRRSLALVTENFHGFSFYFNFKVFNVKIQFFLPFLKSIISEKNHLLKKHSKTDIGLMEKVSAVRDIKSFMETRLSQDEFFPLIHMKKT